MSDVKSPYAPFGSDYLIRTVGEKSRAHIWVEEIGDTACRMWSTGGLRKDRYSRVTYAGGRKLCSMCMQNVTHNPDRLSRKPVARDEVFGICDMLWLG